MRRRLTGDELAGFAEYEHVVCELVGLCGHVEPLGSRDGGAGPTGEGAEDDSVHGAGAAGGSDGSGAGAPSLSECMKEYSDCVREAKNKLVTACAGVWAGFKTCCLNAGVVSAMIGALAACVRSFASAIVSPWAWLARCVAAVILGAVGAVIGCVTAAAAGLGAAHQAYKAAVADCRKKAEAKGGVLPYDV